MHNESDIICIGADWGTTNRRAWALGTGGQILESRQDGCGLLAVPPGGFEASFVAFCGDWMATAPGAPVLMSGMIGSRLGWKEVPYCIAPLDLSALAAHLVQAGNICTSTVWIVPGVSWDGGAQPEVMRGEESQILGALLASSQSAGVFLLPGTHSKWVIVDDRRIIAFRTYMTGEIYGLLRKTGTLSQLMTSEVFDEASFHQGVDRALARDGGNLLHQLFGVRSLALFDRLPPATLASYMSGLMIGAEMQDAVHWLHLYGAGQRTVTAIGAPALLGNYVLAGRHVGLDLATVDSDDLLPGALLSIARSAGLLGPADRRVR